MDDLSTAVLGVVAILVGLGWWRFQTNRDTDRQLRKLFRVSRRTQIAARDVGPSAGTSSNTLVLRADGLIGAPDVIFRTRTKIIAGEFKSRRLNRHILRRELYQITLYMGMLKSRYPGHTIEGRLAYANRCEPVAYDPELYRWLLTYRSPTLELLNQAGK